jgi:hypothetical protein
MMRLMNHCPHSDEAIKDEAIKKEAKEWISAE